MCQMIGFLYKASDEKVDSLRLQSVQLAYRKLHAVKDDGNRSSLKWKRAEFEGICPDGAPSRECLTTETK